AVLPWGALCYYDLFFDTSSGLDQQATPTTPHLETPGILNTDPPSSSDLQRLTYQGHPLPAFVIPPLDISDLRLFHGSCRRPAGKGHDMLAALDQLLGATAHDPVQRPTHLFLTGDQIYGDDVSLPLLFAIMDAAGTLVEYDQQGALPMIHQGAATLG